MEKWEYKTVKFETKGFMGGIVNVDGLNDQLNSLGMEGWELITSFVTTQGSGTSREVALILKRPR